MTVKESIQLLQRELSQQLPNTEISSITAIIFKKLLGYNRADLVLNSHTELLPTTETQIYNIIHQLKRNKPLQYILGVTEFYGLNFFVDESVLIPRSETEELVQWIITDYKDQSPKIMEIGTGSGCIPITLKKFLPASKVWSADISLDALANAQKNARENDVNVTFMEMDILTATCADCGMVDIIVSNPPYVTTNEKSVMNDNVLEYEPHLALFVPQNDPLIFYRAIAKFAQKSLNKNGSIYFEINESLSDETSAIIAEFGFSVEIKLDIHGKYRMLKAQWNDKQ